MTTTAAKTVRTICPMNCHPTHCGMLAEVTDGKLKSIAGDKENPDSQGFLCVRGRSTSEIFGNPKRLLHPMLRDSRDSDAWRRVSWEEAISVIASRMHAAGGEAVGLWAGHGAFTSGGPIAIQLMQRFANLHGCQFWHPAMICWGLGGFGIGLTGALKVNTKEDMARHANMIVLWGANFASQPNTARHVVAARRRGAKVVTIDVRKTEAAAQSDEFFLIRPGSDAALALAVAHVIIGENRYDSAFVETHTTGFDALLDHVRAFDPAWGAARTGLAPERIVSLARDYAATRPAMILIGGSSMHKGANSWHAARAISCLPALTGDFGVAGGGLGPRHGAHGGGLANVSASDRRRPGNYIPNQMSEIAAALSDGRFKVLLLFGTNMLSSFADAAKVASGLAKTDLVVSVDLFMNETARRCADIVLPGTAWLEELGFKMTNSHLYLMERALEPDGETLSVDDILRRLADALELPDFHPWDSKQGLIDTILDHPSTGHATVASLREAGGFVPLEVAQVAYEDRKFDSPSGKIEFYAERAEAVGLPPLPVHEAGAGSSYPLTLCFGRTLTHFHSFYDQGRALATLAKKDPGPRLWICEDDAGSRGLSDGDAIKIYNQRGYFEAEARVTGDVPPGVVWMRDGWVGLNRLTSADAVLPDEALGLFHFSVGQSEYSAHVEIERA